MSRPRAALLVLLTVLCGVLAVALVHVGGRAPAVPGATADAGERSGERARASTDRWVLEVLHGWDARRAAAYRDGSPGRLRSLYTAGSVAGAADARLLRGYRARGLRVVGMRTQVLAVHVLDASPDQVRVRVSDRLVGAVAVRGKQRQALPRDAASSRVVALVRAPGGRWRVSAVSDDP